MAPGFSSASTEHAAHAEGRGCVNPAQVFQPTANGGQSKSAACLLLAQTNESTFCLQPEFCFFLPHFCRQHLVSFLLLQCIS